MTNEHGDLPEILNRYIDPAACSYEEWLQVGMALQQSGIDLQVWEAWSSKDFKRYHSGECAQKWAGFRGSAEPVTSGTIIALAEKYGGYTGQNRTPRALSWDDIIDGHDVKVIDERWLQGEDVPGPQNGFRPADELISYLETLFNADEYVGYVTECYQKESSDPDKPARFLPSKGPHGRTAGELIQALYQHKDDIGAVIGDTNPAAGAWIRFNPLDGKDVRDINVTSYRFALVECDDMEIGKQYAMIKQLELPVAVLVHSGGKSLHAIVRVDAMSLQEYKTRVDYLYKVCEINGLTLDRQNRNPSRLSRMPGVMRNGKPQYIVARNIGKQSWDEWKDHIEAANDDLPDEDELSDWLDTPPDLAPQLICGILRKGHKMLLSGPSKAGKSFALIELCIAIAEGQPWLGFPCAQGHVLYVNLELDKASCLNRFHDVYKAMGYNERHPENITIWNLRGKSEPMDKLAPKLIRRAAKKQYTAIIIDPIYKIITGDENSADQMAAFCNQFDKVATELECSVIYCHHHSKGSQGQKRSSERASGSGVFSRDPDAILDMLQLEVKEDVYADMRNRARCGIAMEWLKRFRPDDWMSQLEGVPLGDSAGITARVMELLPDISKKLLASALARSDAQISARTAWKVEATLREFPPFEPRQLWFTYPIHVPDTDHMIRQGPAFGSETARKKGVDALRRYNEEKKRESEISFLNAMDATDGSTKQVYEYLSSMSQSTIRRRADALGYLIKDGYFVHENDADE